MQVPNWEQKLQNSETKLSDEENEIGDTEENSQEEWMILSNFHYSLAKKRVSDDCLDQSFFNWQSDSAKYTI